MVQGYPILFTADTGASKTIISKRIYEATDSSDRPALSKSSRLLGPSGAVIMELGKTMFSLTLGQIDTEVEVVVAGIDDNGLIGTDVLQNGDRDLLICCFVKEFW